MAATSNRQYRDMVALAQAIDPGPDFHDLAGELVPQHHAGWGSKYRILRDVQIGAANPAAADPEQHVFRSGDGIGHLLDRQWLPQRLEYSGFHDFISPSFTSSSSRVLPPLVARCDISIVRVAFALGRPFGLRISRIPFHTISAMMIRLR
jgi:hypothetical protein